MMKKGTHLLVLFCFLCFLVSACGGGGDSSSFGGTTPGGTTPGGGGGSSDPSGTQKWSTAIFAEPIIQRDNPLFTFRIVSSPAIAADGTIYVGSTDNRLYAFNQNGTVKWRYETGDQIVASPAIGTDGTVYVGSADRQLYAINPTGTLKWVYPTKVILSSSPALGTDGTIYVGGTNLDGTIVCPAPIPVARQSTFYAINPDGSSKLGWEIPLSLSGRVNSSPVIASDGTIYIGSSGDNTLDWTDPCDIATEYPPSDAGASRPVNGHIYAINPNNTIKWDFKALGNVDSSAAIAADGTIYIGSDYGTSAYGTDRTLLIPVGSQTTGYLYAINTDGTLKWVTDLYGHVKSSPAIGSDGTIYVGSDKEDVFALNTNGTVKWIYPTRGPVRSSPALAADGTIYIGSNDSSLYALNPDGTLKLRFIANASITSSPAIIADGTVYFATGVPLHELQDYPYVDGPPALYAINGSSGLAATIWSKFRRDLLNTGRQ
jgi:outer membrane protein assembly factor BamB